jgi:hypothetical protein
MKMRSRRSMLLTVILLISLLIVSSLTTSFAAKPVSGPTATITLNKIDSRNNLAIISAKWSGYESVELYNIIVYIKFDTFDQAIGEINDTGTNEFAVKREIVNFFGTVVLPDSGYYYAELLLRDTNGVTIHSETSSIKLSR